jgi:hypothetical protein
MKNDPDAPDEASDPMTQAALEEALGEEPRARELRQMAEILASRLQAFKAEFDQTQDRDRREKLKKEILKMRDQILVLAEEADITQFVEDSVRLGVEMQRSEDYR